MLGPAILLHKNSVGFSSGAVFGPHGQELIVANDTGEKYDDVLSQKLTAETVTANLLVRDLGFKPYIAPGLSSARSVFCGRSPGQWHNGAVPMDGAYWGCQSRMTRYGPELLRRPLHPVLMKRMMEAHKHLKEFDYDG